MNDVTRDELKRAIEVITNFIGNDDIDNDLEQRLKNKFPPTSSEFREIESICHEAIKAGWMCKYESEGIRYGRVIKPVQDLNGFSVDVVDMNNIRGPHHRHPKGEIDMVMPIEGEAEFDGQGAGWKVYGPNTAHYPTVSGGRALVLYLLPDGEIEFV